jgi:hypothetical protein
VRLLAARPHRGIRCRRVGSVVCALATITSLRKARLSPAHPPRRPAGNIGAEQAPRDEPSHVSRPPTNALCRDARGALKGSIGADAEQPSHIGAGVQQEEDDCPTFTGRRDERGRAALSQTQPARGLQSPGHTPHGVAVFGPGCVGDARYRGHCTAICTATRAERPAAGRARVASELLVGRGWYRSARRTWRPWRT